jgi:hypothetical protein
MPELDFAECSGEDAGGAAQVRKLVEIAQSATRGEIAE